MSNAKYFIEEIYEGSAHYFYGVIRDGNDSSVRIEVEATDRKSCEALTTSVLNALGDHNVPIGRIPDVLDMTDEQMGVSDDLP